MKPTTQPTFAEAVDFAALAKQQEKIKTEEQEYLDWTLSLVIQTTDFGYEQLKKQLAQAKRLSAVGTQEEIMEIIEERYAYSWAADNEDSKGDFTGGSLGSDNR